jgi:hypothetical protein
MQIRFFAERIKYLIVCWKAGPCMSLFDIASPCWVLAFSISPKPPNRRLETSDSPTHQIHSKIESEVEARACLASNVSILAHYLSNLID